MVNLPKVLLLDEPLGALDLKLRKGLQIELKRIQQEIGITFVYVTHDQEEALTMSRSDRGHEHAAMIEQVDGPEEVYERPTTTFVAGFIGVSNLMPGDGNDRSGQIAPRSRSSRGSHVQADAGGLRDGRALPRGRSTGEARVSLSGNGAAPNGTPTKASRESSPARSISAPRPSSWSAGRDARMTVLIPNAERGRALAAARRWAPT